MTAFDQAENLNPRKRPAALARRPVAGAPWFAYPLAFIDEMIEPLTHGVMTLPDAQLASEVEQLTAICGQDGVHHGESVLLAIYRAEQERRGNPELQWDIALDRALSRVERSTNAEDRAFIADVGRKLFSIGGKAALNRAYDRMLALAKPGMAERRKAMLGNRWARIAS